MSWGKTLIVRSIAQNRTQGETQTNIWQTAKEAVSLFYSETASFCLDFKTVSYPLKPFVILLTLNISVICGGFLELIFLIGGKNYVHTYFLADISFYYAPIFYGENFLKKQKELRICSYNYFPLSFSDSLKDNFSRLMGTYTPCNHRR